MVGWLRSCDAMSGDDRRADTPLTADALGAVPYSTVTAGDHGETLPAASTARTV